MLGPVFYLELLRGSRRGRFDWLRRAYSTWLILQFGFLFLFYLSASKASLEPPFFDTGRVDPRMLSRFVNSYLDTFVMQHFILILLTTPPFVAGAIAEEKARGTLQHLLTADLSAWEIVVGKTLARLVQVVVLALAGLPLIAFMGGYGHLDPMTLLTLAVVSIAPLFALSSASILASVLSQRARDAVLRVYLWLIVGVAFVSVIHYLVSLHIAPAVKSRIALPDEVRFVWNFDRMLHCLNPLHVLEPAWTRSQPEAVRRRLLGAVLAWGTVGMFCLSWAVLRLRPVYLRQLEGDGFVKKQKPRTWWQPVPDDAMRWKERDVEGLAFMQGWRKLPRPVGVLLVTVMSIALYSERYYIEQALGTLFVASLVAGARGSGAICGERERQTWDLLLLSPLSTRELVHEKLWGIMDVLTIYFGAYALPRLFMGAVAGPTELFWTTNFLVLTWPAMYFMAALGLWWSARSKSAWRSLLATLASGYAFGLAIIFVSSVSFVPIGLFVSLLVESIAAVPLQWSAFAFLNIGMIWFLWSTGRYYLRRAQNWVAVQERVWSNDNRLKFQRDEFRKLCLVRDARDKRGERA